MGTKYWLHVLVPVLAVATWSAWWPAVPTRCKIYRFAPIHPLPPVSRTPTLKKFLLTPTNKGPLCSWDFTCVAVSCEPAVTYDQWQTVHGRYERMLMISAMATNPVRLNPPINESTPCYGRLGVKWVYCKRNGSFQVGTVIHKCIFFIWCMDEVIYFLLVRISWSLVIKLYRLVVSKGCKITCYSFGFDAVQDN